MKIVVAAIGRERDKAARTLFDRYVERLPWTVALKEMEAKRATSGPARMAEEAQLLLGAVPPGAHVIALDERGEDLSSQALAQRIGTWRDQGVRDLACLIGGADGHAEEVRQRAHLKLAFGRLTWPHLLVRIMLAEQLYRASTILAGHPYHRA